MILVNQLTIGVGKEECKCGAGACHAALHGTERATEDVRHVCITETEDANQHERFPELLGQPMDEFVEMDRRRVGVRSNRSEVAFESDRQSLSSRGLSSVVEADAPGDAENPGHRSGFDTKRIEMSVHPEQGLLYEILDIDGRGIEPRTKSADIGLRDSRDTGKSFEIAVLGQDQITSQIVHGGGVHEPKG